MRRNINGTGKLLYATIRFAEAEIELKRAAELDPLAPIIQSEIGVVMYYSRRYDDAIAQFNKLKQDFPQFPTSYVFLSRCFEQKRMFDESFAEEMAFWKLEGINEKDLNEMKLAFRKGGRQAYLDHLAGWLEASAQTKYVYEYRLTHAYARLQNREKTLEWLEK